MSDAGPPEPIYEQRPRKELNWKKDNPMVPKPQPKKVVQSVDYLKEIRAQREQQERDDGAL